MDTKLFFRSLKWTAIALCLVLLAFYAWKYFYFDRQLPVIEKAPDFTMESSAGTPVTMSKMNGKVRLVYFFFASCPDVCAPTTQRLAKVQKQLFDKGYTADQFQLLSITVDPETDTAQNLNEFAAKNNAKLTNWSFLRAELSQTKKIARSYGVGEIRDADNRLIHNNVVTLVDEDGMIRGVYESEEIKEDVILDATLKLF